MNNLHTSSTSSTHFSTHSVNTGLLDLRHQWKSFETVSPTAPRSTNPVASIRTPAHTSQYLSQISLRTFIKYGEVMPGTNGMRMKAVKKVLRSFPAPRIGELAGKKIDLDYGGLVHFSNNPNRVTEITSPEKGLSYKSLQDYIFNILSGIQKPSKNWLNFSPLKRRIIRFRIKFRRMCLCLDF